MNRPAAVVAVSGGIVNTHPDSADGHDRSHMLPERAEVEGTRGRILLAALELFATRGYHASSIRDVGAEAGLGSASLYSHFASKEALLAELVLIGHDEHHRRLVAALLEAGSRPRDQLVALVRAHVRGHAEFPVLATVANTGLQYLSPEAAAPSLALRKHSESVLYEVVVRGQTKDGFKVDNMVELTCVAIATMGSSIASWWPRNSPATSVAALADTYAVLALRMVGLEAGQ